MDQSNLNKCPRKVCIGISMLMLRFFYEIIKSGMGEKIGPDVTLTFDPKGHL